MNTLPKVFLGLCLMPYTRKNIQLSEYSVNSSHKLLPCLDQFVGHKQMKQQSQLSLDWNKHMQTCYRTSAITLLKMQIFAYEKGCLTTLTTVYHDKKWGMSTAHSLAQTQPCFDFHGPLQAMLPSNNQPRIQTFLSLINPTRKHCCTVQKCVTTKCP